MTRSGARCALVILSVGAGCGQPQMVPAGDARRLPDAPNWAYARSSGIRLAATAEPEGSAPTDVPSDVMPVRVRLVNRSGRPIGVMHERFGLAGGPKGRLHRPLPVLPIDGDDGDRGVVLRPVFAASSFFVGAKLQRSYPSLPPWPHPLPRDDAFYSRQYAKWKEGLPNRSMRRFALPEGVLGDGGQISGFLYFPRSARTGGRVLFRAELDDIEERTHVATIEIPFRIE